ncbi:TniB family NTP-binding protein [Rhodoferax sp. BLA1]|uniref:TniB family NTP-binding protein n=1 Tax=Rhodoferax sp. BLA1 TaxID=2576062 RepID=UPI0015D17603|nr:TniB family NTP-binding protein [Rhodoferax sp. BLA1]
MPTRIEIPDFQRAWARIQECHESGKRDSGPVHLRLLGQSGLGKTFLLKEYRDAFPAVRNTRGTHVPVALLTIPSAPTVKGIYIAFLESLGLHGANGTVEALRHRARVLCSACRVELFLVDELNHLTDRGQIRTREAVGDALKEMLESLNLPTVFSGASRSHVLFDTNMQLRSRVMASLTLRAFNLEERFEDLRGFIFALSEIDQDEETANWLASPEVASRIFFATDGIHRGIARFVAQVGVAIRNGSGSLNFTLLTRVFKDYFWEGVQPGLNPFGDTFPLRRLCEPGEPYSATALDGDNHAKGANDYMRRNEA